MTGTGSDPGPYAADREAVGLRALAEVAVDRSLPLSTAAGELLSAYVAEAGPLGSLPGATARRPSSGRSTPPGYPRQPPWSGRRSRLRGAARERAGGGHSALSGEVAAGR
ncbi:hypothetical protein, partial [Micromonospora sp. MH33]|uniref:hypothetical protein n=1 Tax=Micromonospora sp. MH33 TaxID=1945509 RepID=UPI001AEF6061